MVLLLLSINCPASASEEVRLFVVEKSKNPHNILVVYTQANEQCEIEPVAASGKRHLFDFYWLMDGTTYKPTHPLIKKHVRKRFVAQKLSEDRKMFDVKLADLKELTHDLPSDMISITMDRQANGTCQPHVLLPLGPRADHRTIAIQSIYSKARTLLGIPVGVHYIELRGWDSNTKEKLVVRFNSKKGGVENPYPTESNDK